LLDVIIGYLLSGLKFFVLQSCCLAGA